MNPLTDGTRGHAADRHAYHLPDTPDVRPGITLGAVIDHPGIHGNRVRDRWRPKRQAYGIWNTDQGTCRVISA